MDDIIFLKYTNDIAYRECGEGRHGNYYLGSLFKVTRDAYERFVEANIITWDVGVLNNLSEDDHCERMIFSVVGRELTVVDNDKDLNECIELYTRIYGRDNERISGYEYPTVTVSAPTSGSTSYYIDGSAAVPWG